MSNASDKLGEAAKALGREHGIQRADTTVTSANCTVGAARKILEGYESSNEEVLDLCPNPLSGEWADDPQPMAILDAIADKVDPHELRGVDIFETSDVLDLYEEAYRQGFWDKVILASKSIVDGAA